MFRRLVEGDVRRPLLLCQAEPTDSASLTHSEPCVSSLSVYIYVAYICAKYRTCFDHYLLCSLFILLHVSRTILYLIFRY